ncbi:hypothetical protein [Streptomyces melanogenes]|uniref:hypothetical protein n=1 Tax=Streptomyces melanogenes TaxID=67326 RepID=UPI00167D73C6|nr:hypothetical protein [Streptomyces melanogenes]GGP93023.1 hypothetical protein GCM10010278_83760 [Streptomyces melanogenes]
MSDRSALQLYVYAVPEEDEAAVQRGITDNCLEPDTEGADGIVLGTRYLTDEVPVGSAYDLAAHLLTRAPGTAFELWQNPVHEHSGHYVAHLPGIGSYEGPCTADGSPYVKLSDVLDTLTAGPDDAPTLTADHLTRHAAFFTALRHARATRRT